MHSSTAGQGRAIDVYNWPLTSISNPTNFRTKQPDKKTSTLLIPNARIQIADIFYTTLKCRA